MVEGKFRCQAALPRPSGPHLLVSVTPNGELLPCWPVPQPTPGGLLMAFCLHLRSPSLMEADPIITTGLTSGAERPRGHVPGHGQVCGGRSEVAVAPARSENQQLGTPLPVGVTTHQVGPIPLPGPFSFLQLGKGKLRPCFGERMREACFFSPQALFCPENTV